MTRLLLHIGHPKTGTTALQSVLSSNAATLLKEASVLYPTRTEPSEYKHALAIPWLFQADNESIRRRAHSSGDSLKAISRKYWESLIHEMQSTSHKHVIISAEGFWSILRRASDQQRTIFRNTLHEHVDHIQTIAYIKSPTSYFASKLNQKLRNFRPINLPRHDYISSAISGWEQLGFESYSWQIFDRTLLKNQDIVDDFCDKHLPIGVDCNILSRAGCEQANSSISNEALAILEELTEKFPVLRDDVYDHRRPKIVSILRKADSMVGGQTRPTLKESAKAGIIQRSSDIEWLRNRGIIFPDIDTTEAKCLPSTDLPETFTCVKDFCPINTERLAALRSTVWKPIHQLFQPSWKRLFWPQHSKP
ncbi:hypothetical protein CB0101_09345 [Synechococcus sp. CB0101]|uniref:hypothetical protein n=1 Tax=Synechococcus sp. CB0101 TaxID=232348 RepID=UPI0010AABFED|nr:hypothetical protein [Synechococcus sp. CB0101]QCH15108.1 hypothetical protein CB0101_09345 [Synechococcus sp. CB0101]